MNINNMRFKKISKASFYKPNQNKNEIKFKMCSTNLLFIIYLV